MTKEQLNYIAGLFDGEGSIGIVACKSSKNGRKYLRVQMRIHNSDVRCLRYVREVTGFGWCGPQGRKAPSNHKKQMYVYTASGQTGIRLASLIRPFVHVKGERIDEILAARNHGPAD